MIVHRPGLSFLLIALVCVALIIGGQALASATAPPVQQLSQSKLIGQAGFAYLGGLRMFGAGVLYSRLDPQFHQYMTNVQLQNRIDILPSIRLIQALNPQLEQPYYYVAYILAMRGDFKGALALAREGIANNPQSGLLRASYVEVLMMQDKQKNLPEMLAQSRIGLGKTAQYSSMDDMFESYGIYRTVYQIAGDTAMANMLKDAQARIKATSAPSAASPTGFGAVLQGWQNAASSK